MYFYALSISIYTLLLKKKEKNDSNSDIISILRRNKYKNEIKFKILFLYSNVFAIQKYMVYLYSYIFILK